VAKKKRGDGEARKRREMKERGTTPEWVRGKKKYRDISGGLSTK